MGSTPHELCQPPQKMPFKIDPSYTDKAPGSEQQQLHRDQGGPKDIQSQFNGFLQTLLASLPADKRQQMQQAHSD